VTVVRDRRLISPADADGVSNKTPTSPGDAYLCITAPVGLAPAREPSHDGESRWELCQLESRWTAPARGSRTYGHPPEC
jgi:hypothetical protein